MEPYCHEHWTRPFTVRHRSRVGWLEGGADDVTVGLYGHNRATWSDEAVEIVSTESPAWLFSAMTTPLEEHLRNEDADEWELVIRGRPLSVEGLFVAAGRTVGEFTWRGTPVAAVSAEVTGPNRSIDQVLAGPRLRTRRTFASTTVSSLQRSGFHVLPTFSTPHVSIVLPAYDEASVRALVGIFGPEYANPHYRRTR